MLKKSVTYFLGNLLAALIGFGGLMVITRMATPADYGVFSYIFALTLMIYPLFFTWLRFSVLRDQSANRTLDLRKTIVFATFLIIPFIATAIFLGTYFSIDFKGYHYFLGLMIFLIGIYEIIIEYIRAQQQEKRYSIVVIARSSIYIGTVLICFHFFPNHALGLIIAFCAAYFIAIIIAVTTFIKKPYASLEKKRIKEWIYASPAPTLIALFATLIAVSDRFFIGAFLDLAALGQYAASSELTKQLVMAPAAAFTSIFMNKAIETFHHETTADFEIFMQKSFTFLLGIMLPIVFGLNLIGADAAKFLLGEKYSIVSNQIIPFLAFGIFFNILSNYYFHAIYHAKKLYKPIIFQLFLSVLLNSLFLFILIKPYGLKGAAIAFMCSEALGALLSYFLSQRIIKLNLYTKQTGMIIFINVLLIGLLFSLTMIDNQSIFKIISIILIYALFYFAFIIKNNLFNSKEVIQAAIKRL